MLLQWSSLSAEHSWCTLDVLFAAYFCSGSKYYGFTVRFTIIMEQSWMVFLIYKLLENFLGRSYLEKSSWLDLILTYCSSKSITRRINQISMHCLQLNIYMKPEQRSSWSVIGKQILQNFAQNRLQVHS